MISQVYFGNNKGEFIDAIREKNEIYVVYKASPKDPAQYYLWNNEQQRRGEEKMLFDPSFSQLPANYDPRNRPWYKEGKIRWSGIYDDYHSRELVISAIFPVKNKKLERKMHSVNKRLLGVFGCEFLFTDMNKKLKSIKEIDAIPKETIFFLTDNKNRNLLSTTTEDTISYVDGDDTKPVTLKKAGSALLREIGEQMEKMPREAEAIHDFFYKKRYLIQIIPINDDFGLDWSLVVITPKENLTDQISNHNNENEMFQITSWAMFIALVMWLTSILLKRKYLGRRS